MVKIGAGAFDYDIIEARVGITLHSFGIDYTFVQVHYNKCIQAKHSKLSSKL